MTETGSHLLFFTLELNKVKTLLFVRLWLTTRALDLVELKREKQQCEPVCVMSSCASPKNFGHLIPV